MKIYEKALRLSWRHVATVSDCLCPRRDLRLPRKNIDAVPSFTLLGHSLLRATLPPIANLLVGDAWADVSDPKKRKKTVHTGRIHAIPLPGRFKLDDSVSKELVDVKVYDFQFRPEQLKLSLAAN